MKGGTRALAPCLLNLKRFRRETTDDMFEGVENEFSHFASCNNQVIDAIMWCQKFTPQRPEGCQNGIQIDQRAAKRRSGSQVGLRSLFLFSLKICCFRLLAPLGCVCPIWAPTGFRRVPQTCFFSFFFLKNHHKIYKTRSKKGVTIEI